MLEGSRTFDLLWGAGFGTACFALGLTVIWNWVAGRHNTPSIFGASVDPRRRLQLAWGIFTLAMGGTNYGCRFVPHNYLAGVHETFFALTLLVYAVLIPRLPVVQRGFRYGPKWSANHANIVR